MSNRFEILICLLLVAALTKNLSAQESNIQIRGQVKDQEGKAIVGAKAYFEVYNRDVWNRSTHTAKTDSEGYFTIRISSDLITKEYLGQGDIWIYHPDYDLVRARSFSALEGEMQMEDIVLKSASEFIVKVAAPDGMPVTHATVEPEHFWQSTGVPVLPESVKSALAVRTNDDGTALLKSLDPENVGSLIITTENHGIQRVNIAETHRLDGSVDISLASTGDVSITLEMEDGSMPDGNVTLCIASQTWTSRDDVPKAYSMVREKFSTKDKMDVGKLVAGEYIIFFQGFENLKGVPKLPRSLKVSEDEILSLKIPVQNGVKLLGKIIDAESGVPVRMARVNVRYGDSPYQNWRGSTDENGVFAARVLPGQCIVDVTSFKDLGITVLGHQRLEIDVPDQESFEMETIDVPKMEND